MEGGRGSQRSFVSSGQRHSAVNASQQRSSDNLEDEDDYDSSDDDEMYLDPGEPYGAFLSPTEQPYDRKERVDMLNHLLQNSQPPTRRLPIRVRIREEYNQYFNEESDSPSDSDSNAGDEARQTRPSARSIRPASPRYPGAEKQRSSEGHVKRPVTGVQRPPSSRRGLDDVASNTNNKR